jgi:hypothetical protein
MKNETPKVTTPITATDILAVAAKSEVVPTVLTRHYSIDNTKIEKNWYVERTGDPPESSEIFFSRYLTRIFKKSSREVGISARTFSPVLNECEGEGVPILPSKKILVGPKIHVNHRRPPLRNFVDFGKPL